MDNNQNEAARKPHGIPTLYRGIRFRSRLEARWAAFFDQVGWPWTYEPLDLAGYIPDFLLRFAEALLVEVKPAASSKELGDAVPKIEASGWKGPAAVVGVSPVRPLGFQYPSMGIVNRAAGGAWDYALLCRCVRCGGVSMHASGVGRCLRCGVADCGGDGWPPEVGENEIGVWWAAASNAVQWMPAKATAKATAKAPGPAQTPWEALNLRRLIEEADRATARSSPGNDTTPEARRLTGEREALRRQLYAAVDRSEVDRARLLLEANWAATVAARRGPAC